ncbi:MULTISPECIES: hypothetical protein [Vibrio]|uniref:Uncharacterized protein n=1 Tax=Vibrio proteolyticus NBRC 13287 TaxID=1219065 RepID=U2ZLD8_VIBPR|nr:MULTISPECIES: hypothetical protein [Vibrio]GAD68581.1 hypothetical protein VPR01S_17_00300 [Vibrio proteolyticus NBRC 13287]
MTINKYYVFVPQAADGETHKEHEVQSEKETQRQAMVRQAQQQGGL